MNNEYGHWDTSIVGEFDVSSVYGFVYKVTNTVTGKQYIGKKAFWGISRKQVPKKDGNGTKTSIITKESNWRKYTTSSKHVNADIQLGQKFTFQMISLHFGKGDLAYNEVEQMVLHDVLRSRDSVTYERLFYNGCIPGIKFIPSAIISDETKQKMSDVRKGKPKSTETKQKMRDAVIGKVHSVETKQKISDTTKGKIFSEETKQKMSDAAKNRVHSEETKQKLRDAAAKRRLDKQHKEK